MTIRDGYLYTTRTVDPRHSHPWAGMKRWVNEEQLGHQLYDACHLFGAAAARYHTIGKTNLLTVDLIAADLLCNAFGPETNELHVSPGREVVEMSLQMIVPCFVWANRGQGRMAVWVANLATNVPMAYPGS